MSAATAKARPAARPELRREEAHELRIVEGLVLKHPGVERLWHSAANTLYRFASELRVPVWHLMALRRV